MANLASQGLSVVFAAAGLASDALRGPKRLVLDTIEIDCTVSEAIDYSAEVTGFPTESGANVSDHRILKPVEIAISGIISDTPLDEGAVKNALQVASLGLSTTALAAAALIAGDATVSSKAFDQLVDLYENGSRRARNPDGSFNPAGSVPALNGTLTLVSKYRTYPNMAFTSLRFQRDGGTGYALPFSATFRQILTVDSAKTAVTLPAMAQAAKNLGDQATKSGPAFNFDTNTVEMMDKLTAGKFTQFFPRAGQISIGDISVAPSH